MLSHIIAEQSRQQPDRTATATRSFCESVTVFLVFAFFFVDLVGTLLDAFEDAFLNLS
jgi:hypothetical protein